MATIDDINDVVAAFLVAAADALAITDGGTPPRAFTSASRPALDCCNQLTAWAAFLGDADTVLPPGGMGGADRAKKVGAQPVLTVTIQVTRCAPVPKNDGKTITLPTAEALAAVSRLTNQDAWVLWNHLNHEVKHGELAKVCGGAWRDGITAVENQGGCVGWEVVFRYPIAGGYPLAT